MYCGVSLINEGFEVVGEYGDEQTLLHDIEKLNPNIICLDDNLPDVSGLELLKSIHAEHPAVAVIMVTGDQSLQLGGETSTRHHQGRTPLCGGCRSVKVL
ncbi:MAG: response regulator transcription factor [Thiotrichaceae bacterium]|nr:response regulator transcription factor [Thiotrichaceae bacterium]